MLSFSLVAEALTGLTYHRPLDGNSSVPWRSVMGELRQFHPSLKVSQVKELPKCDLLIIGDSVQDVIILQSENKMKAFLGKNVKVNLPKAYQTSKSRNKILAIKGVPTDITENEFKEFLDLNKINYAKAERLNSKKTAGSYQFFNWRLLTLTKPRLSLPKTLCVM